MKRSYIVANKQKLDTLFDHIKVLRSLQNFEIESQWATYLCIRVSGLLETSLRSLYLGYCDDKAHPYITKYVSYSLEGNRSQNMNPEKILLLVGAFNQKWRDELEMYMSENGRKEAIESVINVRNSAAHGGTQAVTYNNVKDYYTKIWEVIQFIEAQCSI
jgi:hypothetical protein